MHLFKITKYPEIKEINILGFKIRIKRKSFYRNSMRPFKNLNSDVNLEEGGFSLMLNENESGVSGSSAAVRYFTKALKDADIPFEMLPLFGNKLPKYRNKITFTPNRHYKPKEYNNISIFFWEFEDGMEEWNLGLFDGTSAVIAFSAFNEEYYKKMAPEGVNVYRLPFIPTIDFDAIAAREVIRRKYCIPEDCLAFCFNFNYHSCYDRKNPEGLAEAFSKAFPNNEKVCLVIKTVGGDDNSRNKKHKSYLKNKINDLGITDRTIIIEDNLSEIENHSLINACDSYVSLHRGEGIGLGILEAMCLGKPVIATDYGGSTDFVKTGAAFPVPYKLIKPIFRDFVNYDYVSIAADPDIDKAAEYMRMLYEDRTLREDMGKKAMATAKEYCSLDKYRQVLVKILEH